MQQDGTDVGDHLFSNNKFMLENESTESLECRNGSIESTDCGRLDDEEQFHNEHNPEVELSLSRWNSIGEDENNDNDLPAFKRHWLLPNIEVRTIIFLLRKFSFYYKCSTFILGWFLGWGGRCVFESEISAGNDD